MASPEFGTHRLFKVLLLGDQARTAPGGPLWMAVGTPSWPPSALLWLGDVEADVEQPT